jgi:Fibronectin type III domain
VATPTGSMPVAPTVTNVYAQPEGATLFFTTQAAASGNYVQYYTATSNPGGITAKSNGNSTRIDIGGLTAGTSYTFTVTATNASGTGPASAASPTVTAGAYADYWVANGSGLNPNWGFYPGSAGSAVTWDAVVSGITPPTGNSVIQFASTSSNLFTLPFIEHSLIDSDGNANGVDLGGGRLYLFPYTYLVVSVWPTQAGQSVGFQFYQTNAINGELTQENGPSTSLFEDISQNWTPNALSSVGFTFIDLATGGGNPIGSNTSNTIATQQALSKESSVGDYYELSQPDLSVGNYVYIGNGQNPSWGPTSMTAGQWNTYKVPLSAFGNTSFPYGNQILKFALQDTSMLGTNTFYVTALGFTNH